MTTFTKIAMTSFSTLLLTGCLSGQMSVQQQNALGEQQEQKLLRQVKIVHGGKLDRAVHRVGAKIASASGRSDFQWKYHLVNNPNVANAFVYPGGKVFVYTGLFKYVANDAELAAVLGHEVTHALKSHGVKGSARSQTAGLLGQALKIGMDAAGVNASTIQLVNTVYGKGAEYGYIKPHSRENELEADSNGLMLMARAGYNPKSALTFWGKFGKKGQQLLAYLSTHPAAESRIENLENLLPKAMEIYKKSKH